MANTLLKGLLLSLMAGLLVGCGGDRGERWGSAGIDFRSPFGQFTVKPDVDTPDTGLATYPGAVLSRRHDRRKSANVDINTSWFGVKVAAAEFESVDAPPRIIDFYKSQLAAYGEVIECRGEIDFKGRHADSHAVCRDRGSSSRHVELVAGSNARHRIVTVTPTARGSEFSLVYLETRGDN